MPPRHRSIALVVSAVLLISSCSDDPSPSTDRSADVVDESGEDNGGATNSDGGADGIDLGDVDPCMLLDQGEVKALTGESVEFASQDGPDSCFWGAVVPGVPAYVEIMVFNSRGLASFDGDAGCTLTPVSGVGAEAEGGSCPPDGNDPKPGARLHVFDRGVLVIVYVTGQTRTLTATDLVPTAEAVFAEIS